MPENQLTPVAWQKFGDEYCLTGQFGTRPIFLSVGLRPKPGLRLLSERGLLIPFTPDHPHAKRIVDGWNKAEALKALLTAAIKVEKDIEKTEHFGPGQWPELDELRAAIKLCEQDPNS